MRGGRLAGLLGTASALAAAVWGWRRSRRRRRDLGAGDGVGSYGDEWRRRLSDQLDLYHVNAGPGIAYTRRSDPYSDQLPGPLCNFRIDSEGRIEVWNGPRFVGYDDLSGWWRRRLWWWSISAAVERLHDDFKPTRADDHHNTSAS